MFYYLTNSELNKTSAAIGIGGPDANTYLQGQFTQEINRSGQSAAYGLFLSQKGKVIADGHVLRLGRDAFWLFSQSTTAQKLCERLESYIIADEVTIKDETDLWARIALWGDGAVPATAKLIGAIPEFGFWAEARGIRVFASKSGPGEPIEFFLPPEQIEAVIAELVALGAQESSFEAAERTRILNGIPSVPADIGANDLPNEGGLDEVAISYTKGCYLGQEVMARLKNLGQVRRRLHIVRGGGTALLHGMSLFHREARVGDLRSFARDGDGYVALAMLSLANLEETDGLSLSPNGPVTFKIVRRV